MAGLYHPQHRRRKAQSILPPHITKPRTIYGARSSMLTSTSLDDDTRPSNHDHRLPLREQRGPLPPPTQHTDAVLDLKMVDVPMRLMLSCSR